MNIKDKYDVRFVSLLYDTTFKFLWKRENSKKWFTKLIRLITTIDLDDYELYDPELNSGNEIKDYTLDILFIKSDGHESVNVEMYSNNQESNRIKSGQYAFRLLGNRMKEGEKYLKHNLVQVNFYNGHFKDNKNMNIMCYQIKNENGEYEKNYLKIYDVYLSNYKGLCYNEANELDAMLSFLTGDSYGELIMIANGNKEALEIVKDLEDLAMEEKYWGVYDRNKENIIMQNTMYDEGMEQGLTKGTQEEKRNIARKLLEMNIGLDKIKKATGLSEKEIINLQ